MEKISSHVPELSLHRVVVVTALFIAVYGGFAIAGNATRSYQLSVQTRELQRTVAQDQTELAQLDALRRYMRTDTFIEAQARQEGLGMPGDIGISVSAPAEQAATEQVPSGAWWEHYYGR